MSKMNIKLPSVKSSVKDYSTHTTTSITAPSFPRALSSALFACTCIAVSSVSDVPISQLAEIRSQPQINDPARSATFGADTFLQSRSRSQCVTSPNIHLVKTTIALCTRYTMHTIYNKTILM